MKSKSRGGKVAVRSFDEVLTDVLDSPTKELLRFMQARPDETFSSEEIKDRLFPDCSIRIVSMRIRQLYDRNLVYQRSRELGISEDSTKVIGISPEGLSFDPNQQETKRVRTTTWVDTSLSSQGESE